MAESRWGSGRGGRPWRRKRERIFKRDLYLCQDCKRRGHLTAVELHGPMAGVCDHIKPLSQGGTDDDHNLQTLCQDCSDRKTIMESGGSIKQACGADGWPV